MQNLVIFVFLSAILAVRSAAIEREPLRGDMAEDAFLNMTQLITKYGYPVESYTVQTADGYLLSMYRIPHGKNCEDKGTPKVPVLLQHGLLSSSYDYIIMGPKKSLGYILADNCYDVWLGNNRGNSLSRGHVKLTTEDKKYWDFSWHELGQYDLPAMIDFILEKTNQPSLHYFGHSQGTTQFFVFGSLYPEYQSKVRSMHALSPVAFMENLQSPLVRILHNFEYFLEAFLNMIGVYEFLPGMDFLNLLGSEVCKNEYPNFQEICTNVLFLLCGFDGPQLNRTHLPAIIGHTPAGAATKEVLHYSQGIKSGKFRQYDYGVVKNLKVYKSFAPPNYKLSNIKIPCALYYGANDWLAHLKDVAKLQKKLPNIVENYLVPYPKYNHLDFIFGTDSYMLLYNRILEVLKKF